MIKKTFTKVAMMSLAFFLLSGQSWAQDQAGVASYLKEIDSIQAQLTVVAKNMQASTAGLQESISNGTFDPGVINAKLAEVKEQMITEQNRLRLLTGPESIKSHQYYMDQQITLSTKMLSELPPMLVRTKKLLDLDAEAKASQDPAVKEKAQAALKIEEQAILGHQAAVKGFTAELNKVTKEVESERAKLDKLAAAE